MHGLHLRDKAKEDIRWLWLYYPAMISPPSASQIMLLIHDGIIGGGDGQIDRDALETAHARAIDATAAFKRLGERHRAVLRIAYHPASGPILKAVDRVRAAFYREGGSGHCAKERLESAAEGINLALDAYARRRWAR